MILALEARGVLTVRHGTMVSLSFLVFPFFFVHGSLFGHGQILNICGKLQTQKR